MKHIFNKHASFLIMVLACILAGENYASAQTETQGTLTIGSSEITPLLKFDMGIPNPNARKPEDEPHAYYKVVIPPDPTLQVDADVNTIEENSDYSIMTISEDGTEYSVGQIPYHEDVTSSGGKVYNVPIMVSPISDFTPQISLQYNSQAGNGVAGYGWNIEGLSAIRLSNKNIYFNGKVAPADLNDTTAVYTLDGVPLVQHKDSVFVEEYPLKTAKGHAYVKKHMSGNNVAYFTVIYPDGSKAVYGMRQNTSAKSVYPIISWEDRNGNQIQYNYHSASSSSSEYRISNIQYGNKNNSAIVGIVDFAYTSREDYHVRYYSGERILQNKILKRIISKSGDSILCTYDITHELRNGVNLLTSIGCENSSGEELRPLTFIYGDTSSYGVLDFSLNKSMFLSSAFIPEGNIKIQYTRGKYISDSYHDGIMSVPIFSNYGIIESFCTGESEEHPYRYKYGSLYDPTQEVFVAPVLDFYSYVDNSIEVGDGFQCINAVDIEGDGVDEIVKVNFDGDPHPYINLKITTYDVRTSGAYEDKVFYVGVPGTYNDGGFFESPAQRCYLFGDFKGDGKSQLLTISFSDNPYYTTGESYFALIDLESESLILEQYLFLLTYDDYINGKIACLDLDGDGRTEICHLSGSNLNIYNLNDNSLTLTKTIPTVSNLLSTSTHFTDINGDGYVDIAREPIGSSEYWYIYQYDGKAFESKRINLQGKYSGDKFQFFDLNNDGLADLIQRRGTTVYVYLNENGTYVYENRITSSGTFSEKSEFIPCNLWSYNSMSDFITVEDFYIDLYKFTQDLSADRLLTMSTDSWGRVTINAYADMQYLDGVYDITSTLNPYEVNDGFSRRRFPMFMLRHTQSYESERENTTDLIANLNYTYYDACVHSRGLGFCGFGKVMTVDYQNDVVSIVENDPEKMGVQVHATKSLLASVDSPFEEMTNTYDENFSTYGKYNPRLVKSEAVDYLTGLSATTTIAYDKYDFPTSTMIEKTYGDERSYTEKLSNSYEHHVAADKYILGSVKKSSVTKDGTDSLATGFWFQRSVMTYDDSCRPLTRKDYVGNYGEVTYIPYNPQHSGLDSLITGHPGGVLIDPSPSTPSININREGYLVCETQWEYDSYGNVISEKSAPYGATTFTGSTFTYDSDGRFLTSSTNPLGHTVTYSGYNKFGRPTLETDHLGRVTSYTYDDWGNLTETSYPDGSVAKTIISWGGEGLYTVQKTMTGAPSEIVHYDVLDREVRNGVRRFNGQWQYVDKEYDDKGRLYKESLPYRDSRNKQWNIITYDDYGRKTSVEEASGNQSTWMYDGSEVRSVQNGVGSVKTYDAGGNLVSVADAGGVVTYSLRDDGQPLLVTLSGGIVTTFTYDKYGRRSSIVDPSAGTQTESVTYNDDGSSVLTHTNPNGTIITYIDRFGRRTKVERPGEYTTDYTYDSNGLLVSEVSSNGTSKVYTYDGYDRLATLTETVPDGKWLKKTYTYNVGGTVSSVGYESQSGLRQNEKFVYSYGSLVSRKLGSMTIFQLNSENELGQPTSVTTGNLPRTYAYTSYGMPTQRVVGPMNYSYSFDQLTGNLLSRTDVRRNQSECFGYDNLNRLVSINDRIISYFDNGNIEHIDGVGYMTYDNQNKPYQVTSVHLTDNVVPARVQNVSYTCYSRPSIITEGGRSAAFTYNGDGARVKMYVSDNGIPVLSRYYIGDQYELDVTTEGTTERLYLGGDAYSAPSVYIKRSAGTNGLYHIGRDYLGSIMCITDVNGNVVEENSYDPWGRLRNPDTKEIYQPGTEPELMLGRGYTGHEHLTWFGLINMNARLYDPVLGRFLSPDPFIQMPDFSQSFNRYSYCLNNPLIFVDQSGELFIIDSFLVGLFGGGWKRAVAMAKNDIKIWGGLFVTDPNKSFWGRVGELASRFTWQLPQTICGFITAHVFNTCRLFKGVDSVEYLYGSTVVNTNGDGAELDFIAVTQGSYIVGDNELEADPANALFQHEYGHYIQSQIYGMLYYGKFGIPSLFSKNTTSSHHSDHPVEQDANIRALKYYHHNGLDSVWNPKNRITGYNHTYGYNNPNNQAALKNLIKLNWYDFVDPIIISGIVNTCVLNSKY